MRLLFYSLFIAGVSVIPLCAEDDYFYGDASLISLLKKDDSLQTNKLQTPADQSEVAGFTLGARFGLIYPGESKGIGEYHTGPFIGGYLHIDLGYGILEFAVDIASFKTPHEIESEYTLWLKEEANFLFHLNDSFFVGGGVALVNATPMNRMIMVQGLIGYEVFDHADITFVLYFPLGPVRNKAMAGLCLGYRF